MKRILLLSDTHSDLPQRALELAKEVDEVWHAGDIGSLKVTDKLKEVSTLRAVYGNIDNHQIRQEFPLDQHFEIEGLKVWITHIGGYPDRYSPRVKQQIYKNPPGLFISGHSHILKVKFDQKINCLHMNPGAVGGHGFHKVRTLLRFVVANGKVQDLEAIELEKR